MKTPPVNAGDTGSISCLGRSHMLWSNYVHVPQLLSLCSRAWELQLLSPRAAITEGHTPLSPCSATREATAMRSPCTTRAQPLLTTTREKPMYQWRPGTDNKWIIIKKIIKDNHLYCGNLSHGASPRQSTLRGLSVYISCQYTGKRHPKNIKNKENPPPSKP